MVRQDRQGGTEFAVGWCLHPQWCLHWHGTLLHHPESESGSDGHQQFDDIIGKHCSFTCQVMNSLFPFRLWCPSLGALLLPIRHGRTRGIFELPEFSHPPNHRTVTPPPLRSLSKCQRNQATTWIHLDWNGSNGLDDINHRSTCSHLAPPFLWIFVFRFITFPSSPPKCLQFQRPTNLIQSNFGRSIEIKATKGLGRTKDGARGVLLVIHTLVAPTKKVQRQWTRHSGARVLEVVWIEGMMKFPEEEKKSAPSHAQATTKSLLYRWKRYVSMHWRDEYQNPSVARSGSRLETRVTPPSGVGEEFWRTASTSSGPCGL